MVAADIGCAHYPGQPGSHGSTGPMDLAAAIRCFPDPFEGVLRDSLPRHPFHPRPIRRAHDKKGPQPVPRLQHTPLHHVLAEFSLPTATPISLHQALAIFPLRVAAQFICPSPEPAWLCRGHHGLLCIRHVATNLHICEHKTVAVTVVVTRVVILVISKTPSKHQQPSIAAAM